MKKVLIFYTAHSIGHKRVADNLAFWFKSLGWQVTTKDAFGIYNNSTSLNKSLSLHVLIYKKMSFLWKWLYDFGYILFFPFRRLVARKYLSGIFQIIQEENPDLVITTQTSPSAVLSVIKTKGLWKGKWAIAFSDYHFHPFWVYPGADGYLANIEEQISKLPSSLVKKNTVAHGGLWLPPKASVSVGAIKDKLGISSVAKVVLVGAGSGGWLSFSQVFFALESVVVKAKSEGVLVVPVILSGRETGSFDSIKKQVPDDWKVLPFYEPMVDLYAISDLFITKPGGLSIAEALQWRLPCFVPFLLPGQENLNLDFLTKRDLVVSLIEKPFETWAEVILEELKNGKFKASLENNPAVEVVTGKDLSFRLSSWINSVFHEDLSQV